MEYLLEPNSPLLKFLNPLELLKLLHVSRAARKAAVPHLKACCETADPETRVHGDRFRKWLTTSPIVATGSMVFHEEMAAPEDGNLAGPLRLGTIEKMSTTLVNRFVVLQYKKLGYQREHCKLAVFNGQGEFVAYYELLSKQFYEPFVDKWVHGDRGFNSRGGSNHSTAEIQIRNCNSDDWTLTDQSLEWAWQEGFGGDVTSSNYDLFDSFFGQLSPTEVSFVLMHALSEDTRVIYQYVETVFDRFNQEFEWMEDEDEDEQNEIMVAWKERLAAVSYQEHRPQLRFEVGTEVLCWVRQEQHRFGLSRDQWLPGHVVKHWYRQPEDGTVVPYRVKLDPRHLFGKEISVLTDTDSVIKQLQRPRLRFPIGTEVLCLVSQNKWRPGRVTQHWYINQTACWNPHVYSRQQRTMAPYRVKIDAGPDFSAPVDRDSIIKLKSNDNNPEGTGNILDLASDSKKKKKRKRSDEISAAETGNHNKKKNKKDNLTAPKRPAKAFVTWSIQNRERVKLANPDIHEDDIGKLLRSQWKQLLEEEKTPFEDHYQAEKECYKKEKAAYKLEKG